jgi:gamma-glutamylcysteine synthetase
MNAYLEAPKKGLLTELENKKLYEWGEIFLKLAKEGLTSRKKMNSKNKDETIYLLHTENVIKNRKNRAQLLLDKFEQKKNLEFFNDEKEDFSYSGL